MNATTVEAAKAGSTLTLFFDGTCRLCANAAARWRGLLEARGFSVLPLQGETAQRALGLAEGEVPDEMKLVGGRGVFGGADALIEIARRIWWARPVASLASLPPARNVLRRAYATMAKRRHSLGGACRSTATKRQPQRGWFGWLPLLTLPAVTVLVRGQSADWVFMWAFAFSIFFGCKWLTWWQARSRAVASATRSFAYLFCWVGMDAENFLSRPERTTAPASREWFVAAAKTLLGVVLVWAVVRILPVEYPLLRGWCGLVGLVFALHFGTLHLLALAWRARGIDAQPIMRAPVLAASLAEFWSRRWNVAFHQLAEREIFKPLLRRTNPATALLATFAISGLIHDAVISLPARGGYGLPTCYFLLQGFGVGFERSVFGRRMGLARGWRGRVFAWFVTVAPLPLLFHDLFITRVILPFLDAIHAL